MTKPPDWQETLDDLEDRRQRTLAMGGPERLAKHHGKGKLDARARIDHLLDPGTFREIGTLVGGETAADGIVVGSGLINGSPVMLGAEDFTTLAGSIGPGGNSKRYRIAELALRDKIPLVMLLEGAGFRPGGGHYGRSPTDLLAQAQCSGRVPTVARRVGPVGRARRVGGAGVRLPHHERAGRHLHRRASRRQRVDRRRYLERGPRRTRRGVGQRGDP